MENLSEMHSRGCGCGDCASLYGKGDSAPPDGPVFVDTPGNSTTTVVLSPGTPINDVIEILGDRDWYRVNLTAGQTYTFVTSATGAGDVTDTVIRLLSQLGAELASNDDASPTDLFSRITFTATTSGVHYLEVGTYQDSETGNFRVTMSTSTPTTDTIPGDTSTAATLTVGGTAVNGNTDSLGDHDWYRVQLTAGQTYIFQTNATGGTGDTDSTITLRDAGGNQIAFNDDGGPGTYSALRYTATTSGTFYIDVGAYNNEGIGTYQVAAAIGQPLSVYTNDQVANFLINTYWEAAGARRYNVGPGGTITYNVSALTAEGQNLAREALLLWSDATGISFSETAGSGQITFDDNQSGAFATSVRSGAFITSSNVNVSTTWLTQYGTSLNSYTFQAYVHEIGHAIGLGHGGPYNSTADYIGDAVYLNDSWATSVMSYFDQSENSYFSNLGFTRQFAVSPMSADIVAMQTMYGIGTTTRTGDTVYGFGNNSGRAIFDAAQFPSVSYVVVDNGGTDLLNYSGFSAAQRIDLRAEQFSNIGGRVGNVSIARGTVIENAYGGSGIDVIVGNDAANLVLGNGGNDELYGFIGSDQLYGQDGNDYISGGDDADYLSGGDGNDLMIGGPGADTVLGGIGDDEYYQITSDDLIVEYDGQGNDRIFTEVDYVLRLASYVETLSTTSNTGTSNINLTGNELSNVVVGNAGTNRIDGGAGSDSLYGGTGSDYFYFSSALGAGNVDAIGDFASVDDLLMIDSRVFTGGGLALGFLDAAAFLSGAGATAGTSAAHRFVHNSTTGDLFYDADGSGAQAAVRFANIGAGTAIQNYDFFVI